MKGGLLVYERFITWVSAPWQIGCILLSPTQHYRNLFLTSVGVKKSHFSAYACAS